MNAGWIKLYRKLLKSAIWKSCNNAQKVILITLLLQANHTEQKIVINNKEMTIPAGSLFTSIDHLKELCGKEVTARQIRYALDKFQKLDFLSTKSVNNGTCITIEKWTFYQVDCNENVTQVSNECKSNVTQVSTNKNINNIKNKKMEEEVIEASFYCSGDDAHATTKFSLSGLDLLRITKSWNAIEGLAEIKSLKLDTKRGRMLYARCKEYGIEEVIAAIDSINQSSFLRGMKTSWRATFDWVVKPNNFIKVLEGQYIDKKGDSNVYNNGRSTENDRNEGQTYCERYGIADTEVPF